MRIASPTRTRRDWCLIRLGNGRRAGRIQIRRRGIRCASSSNGATRRISGRACAGSTASRTATSAAALCPCADRNAKRQRCTERENADLPFHNFLFCAKKLCAPKRKRCGAELVPASRKLKRRPRLRRRPSFRRRQRTQMGRGALV
jgi:hypothetical protein